MLRSLCLAQCRLLHRRGAPTLGRVASAAGVKSWSVGHAARARAASAAKATSGGLEDLFDEKPWMRTALDDETQVSKSAVRRRCALPPSRASAAGGVCDCPLAALVRLAPRPRNATCRQTSDMRSVHAHGSLEAP